MPRAPVPGKEIRRRSRTGCWNCKARKVKCGEEKPRCGNCTRLGDECDYKLRLSWGGRPLKKKQMQNGAQEEDESMFLPGAGQFSVSNPAPGANTAAAHAFNPAPTSYGAGPPRKPRPPKKTGMSSFQNVFSVAESSATPPPTVSPPNGLNSNGNGNGTHQQQPLSTSATPATSPLQRSGANWGPGKGKVVLPPASYPTSEANGTKTPNIKEEPRSEYPMQTFGSFPPVSTPIDGFAGLKVRSPTSPRVTEFSGLAPSAIPPTTPVMQYASASQNHMGINAPPPTPITSFAGSKEYRPPPLDELQQKDWKRVRTNLPSVGDAAMSQPYYTSADSYLTLSPIAPITNSYPYTTFTPSVVPSFPMQSSVVPPSPTILRRVPVEHLLATPIGDMTMPTTYVETPQVLADAYSVDQGSGLEDDDVEEITRYDDNYYGNPYASAVGMFGPNDTSIFFPKKIPIPRALDPLPQSLLENRTNRMYFYHFLDETARLLVPHDCDKNPFRKILPQMAVHADHLLNLLLAYSASHRARLLEEPEPTEKIAGFLDFTVKSLTKSLNSPTERSTDITLATAIMLSSYEIISPNAFNTTWQSHLSAARSILLERARRNKNWRNTSDPSSYFLVRWFAYLDVLGSLSGEGVEPLLPQTYWTEDPDPDEPHEIQEAPVDCVTGFTTRCVQILAQIGDLARKCERQRKHHQQQMRDYMINDIDVQWQPSADILKVAKELADELESTKSRATACCDTRMEPNHTHVHSPPRSPGSPKSNSPSELLNCNLAFHCAALVHLYRRVFFYPREKQCVQDAASQIVQAFKGISKGGNAENCLLFPLFTAGCEVLDEEKRNYVYGRMEGLEKIGMVQFGRAKNIMVKVWETGMSWSEVVGGEFIG